MAKNSFSASIFPMDNAINTSKDLISSIQGIIVKDYGDFKRKAVLYINRFVQENSTKLSSENLEVLRELKTKIQYHPNNDIESTKQLAISSLSKIQ